MKENYTYRIIFDTENKTYDIKLLEEDEGEIPKWVKEKHERLKQITDESNRRNKENN